MEKNELNIDEILLEMSWRLSDGIVDFKKDESISMLREVLEEMGYDNKFIDEFTFSVKYPIK